MARVTITFEFVGSEFSVFEFGWLNFVCMNFVCLNFVSMNSGGLGVDTVLGGPRDPPVKTLAVLQHMHRARLQHISSVR